MRFIVPATLAVLMAALPAVAGTDQPLSPGKPAGVKEAQATDNALTIAFGVGLLAAGIAIATTGGNGNNTITTTTTSTSP